MRFTPRRWRRAARITASPGSGLITARATMPPSPSIRTVIASRRIAGSDDPPLRPRRRAGRPGRGLPLRSSFLVLRCQRGAERETRLVERFGGADAAHAVVEITAQRQNIRIGSGGAFGHLNGSVEYGGARNGFIDEGKRAGFVGGHHPCIVEDV